MKKTLFLLFILIGFFANAQTVLKMGIAEYSRYALNSIDSSIYEDYWNGQTVQMTKTNTQGEKIIDIAGALYNAIGISTAGNAWIFGQGNITPTSTNPTPFKVLIDTMGTAFSGNTACAGYFGTYLTIRNGSLWYWGSDDMKFFGKAIGKPIALKMPAGISFTRIKMGNIILALASNGDLYKYEQGNQTPQKLALPGPVSDFATSHTGFYLAIVNGDPYGWGFEPTYMGLTTASTVPVSLKSIWNIGAPIVKIIANHNTIHLIDNKGRLFGMGDNAQGEVGIGSELVNRSEIYRDPPYQQARPYAWSWILHGSMIMKPVQIGPIGEVFTDLWAGESYAFYYYAQTASGNLYFNGRGKSWVAGNDWTGNDIYANAYDKTLPTKIDVWHGNVNMGKFVPGVVSIGKDHTITGKLDTLLAAGIASTGYKISSWQWTQLSGSAIINTPLQSSTVVAFTSPGLYTFKVLMTDNNGGTVADTINVKVTIPNISPTANIFAPDSVTLPLDSLMLNGMQSSDVDGSIISYMWSQLAGPDYALKDSIQSIIEVKNMHVGTYLFTLRVTDNMGAVGISSKIIVVKPKPYIKAVSFDGDLHTLIITYSDGNIVTQQ